MMSDERHEMAERLRALLDDDMDFDDSRSDVNITEVEVALLLVDGFYDNSTKAECVQHLADLIDRQTCHLDLTDVETYGNLKVRIYECSECGRTCEEIYGKYERCPHCGAEVIDD